MASRRMISIKKVDSAKFLKLPNNAQNLFFHLLVRADDDGVVEAYNVIRLSGSVDADLDILQEKGFVLVLNDDLVAYIIDWLEHNKVRAERKVDSIYKDLLDEKIKESRIQATKAALK